MDLLIVHPIAQRLALDSAWELRVVQSHVAGLAGSGEEGIRVLRELGDYYARRTDRGEDRELLIRTSDRDAFDRFTLVFFGWRYREGAGLPRIHGPVKTPALPDDVRVDTEAPRLHVLSWIDPDGKRGVAEVGRVYAHYLGLSLPYSLEELDAAIRHPTGAPIFVPQPPFDPSRLPSSDAPPRKPSRPWRRRDARD